MPGAPGVQHVPACNRVDPQQIFARQLSSSLSNRNPVTRTPPTRARSAGEPPGPRVRNTPTTAPNEKDPSPAPTAHAPATRPAAGLGCEASARETQKRTAQPGTRLAAHSFPASDRLPEPSARLAAAPSPALGSPSPRGQGPLRAPTTEQKKCYASQRPQARAVTSPPQHREPSRTPGGGTSRRGAAAASDLGRPATKQIAGRATPGPPAARRSATRISDLRSSPQWVGRCKTVSGEAGVSRQSRVARGANGPAGASGSRFRTPAGAWPFGPICLLLACLPFRVPRACLPTLDPPPLGASSPRCPLPRCANPSTYSARSRGAAGRPLSRPSSPASASAPRPPPPQSNPAPRCAACPGSSPVGKP